MTSKTAEASMRRRRMMTTLALGIGGLAVRRAAAATGAVASTLRPLAPMLTARAAHTSSAVGTDGVLIVGGFTGLNDGVAGAEWLDLRTGRWTALGDLRPRHSHSATIAADGRVVIAGGYDDRGTVTAAVEWFDLASRRVVRRGTLLTARAGHEVLRLADDRLLVVGGIADGWRVLDRVEWLDASGRATGAPPMATAREGHAAITLQDGRVLVAGGHRGRGTAMEVFASTEVFDPATGRWTPGPAMSQRRHKHDIVRLSGGRVLIVGGADERDDRGAYDTTEIFDPASGGFRLGPRLVRARYKLRGSSHVLPDGRVLVAGGASQPEILDVGRGRGEIVDGPPLAGLFSASTPLGDGRTVVTGGYGMGRGAQPGAWVVVP